MACNSKRIDDRVTQTETWESGRVVAHIRSTLDISLEGDLGVIVCTPLKMACDSKLAGHTVKL